MKDMLLGMLSDFAWWKAPLSSITILNSVGFCAESWSINSWNVWLLQWGNSSRQWAPVIGENAPNKYRLSKRWRKGATGLIPLAVIILRSTVNSPKRLSSWKYRLIVVQPLAWYLFLICSNFPGRFFKNRFVSGGFLYVAFTANLKPCAIVALDIFINCMVFHLNPKLR